MIREQRTISKQRRTVRLILTAVIFAVVALDTLHLFVRAENGRYALMQGLGHFIEYSSPSGRCPTTRLLNEISHRVRLEEQLQATRSMVLALVARKQVDPATHQYPVHVRNH